MLRGRAERENDPASGVGYLCKSGGISHGRFTFYIPNSFYIHPLSYKVAGIHTLYPAVMSVIITFALS